MYIATMVLLDLCPKSVDLALTPVVSLGDMRRRKGCRGFDIFQTLKLKETSRLRNYPDDEADGGLRGSFRSGKV